MTAFPRILHVGRRPDRVRRAGNGRPAPRGRRPGLVWEGLPVASGSASRVRRAAILRRRGAAFRAARAGNGIAHAIVTFSLSHFSILKRHIVRKREEQRSAAQPRHICQTATGLAAALPPVNRGGEGRGGMCKTAGKEWATTIAARSWRSRRISSPLSFLGRQPPGQALS